MTATTIRLGTWGGVADGRKGLLLRNDGNAANLKLKVVEQLETERIPRTSELGSDRPGRGMGSASGKRSAVEQTDWHQREEDEHARGVAAAIEKHCQAGDMERLVVVAPPKTLAVLREAFGEDVRKRVIEEIPKDLTKHPISEIE